jgi:curved DNA-binding protein CbpA
MTITKNLYQVLGVQEDAEDIVIRAAYKALAQKYHPDKWSGDVSEANRLMAELNNAYKILSDPLKRREYDAGFRSGITIHDQDIGADNEASSLTRVKVKGVSRGESSATDMVGPFLGVSAVLLLVWWNSTNQKDEPSVISNLPSLTSETKIPTKLSVDGQDSQLRDVEDTKALSPLKSDSRTSDNDYRDFVAKHIRKQIVFDDRSLIGNPVAIYWVSQDKKGRIVTMKQLRSSGVSDWDAAVERAILSSMPLPIASDGTFVPEFELRFRPKRELGD